MIEHGFKAYDAYQQSHWGSSAINGGKLILDGTFTFAKVSNPFFWGGAIVYGVIDYATNDY